MESETNTSQRPKIVVIGSCSVDFTTYSSRLPKPGETLHGTKFTTSFGGKGANQCVAAAKLGGNAYMISRIGADHWGQQYKDNLKSYGIDVTYTHITPDVTTGIAQISVAENGENQIVIVPGANSCLSKADVEEANNLIIDADVLIGQLETPFQTTLEAFKLNKGIKLLNAAPAGTDIDAILPYCTILCVNEPEASLIVGFDVNMNNIKIVLEKLLETGCAIAIITLGGKGAAYCSKKSGKSIYVACDNVAAVDTTGAGDAFVGALGTFIVNNKNLDLHQIIGAACEIATLSVTKEGTQISYPAKYDVFKKIFHYVDL